ncbi:KpsF/GutQ family sugar-phosphate isomerase [Sporocytophaga myxococcoides]|uniref:KpsF/GutQ family sugar-phosphate isomerase n=1 Tax=Sporocytophaga myxococcoides TaxID=153721 RepID=UPI000491286D|nr:KpsF/GutQ family sugar-phosphate isomerase [Sporocytophaga myxococcoides]
MKLVKNIRNTAINVLLNEADAIKKLVDFINEDFEKTVEAILRIKGRVVVTGIGKSAIIGSKIVATLNSTGTPAVFMHAADAIHGDLGMIQKDDIVICLSKSGNTPEIKVLVPLIKRTGCQMIALVGNTESFLAQEADFILNATVEKEACPNNLAPTTSTTATLAIGDALAVCLLEMKNFSSSDFALYHPGGSLGKRLYLRVGDIFPHNSRPAVKANAGIKEVIFEISSKRLGATAVLNENDELIGIVTDGDIRRMLDKFGTIEGIKAIDIMSPNPKTIDSEEYAVNALNIMQQNNITQLVVVNGKKVEGFIHLHDLLKEGLV